MYLFIARYYSYFRLSGRMCVLLGFATRGSIEQNVLSEPESNNFTVFATWSHCKANEAAGEIMKNVVLFYSM